MRRDRLILLGGLVAAVAGCSARAESERRPADEAGDVRIDREAVQSLLTPAHLVSVVGTARTSIEPDIAEISVGVTSTRRTALEAVRANSAEMTDLIEALKKRGVAAKDIQTSQLWISPRYSQPAQSRPGVPEELTVARVVGYDVVNTVRVTVRDRAKVGDLVDAALQAGSNQMYGISFRVEDRESALAGLRARAFDDAKAKAEVYAKRSGMTLGPIHQVSEPDPSMMGFPAPAPGLGMVMPAPRAPASPVAAGQEEVSFSVSVSFELIATKR